MVSFVASLLSARFYVGLVVAQGLPPLKMRASCRRDADFANDNVSAQAAIYARRGARKVCKNE